MHYTNLFYPVTKKTAKHANNLLECRVLRAGYKQGQMTAKATFE